MKESTWSTKVEFKPSIYISHFNKNNFPDWVCPSCKKSILKPQKDTFCFAETMASKSSYHHHAWEPDWTKYVYSGILECSSCKEIVANSGIGWVEWNYYYDDTGNEQQGLTDVFYPKYFFPNLNLFICPTKTPSNVLKEIEQSFSLFFCNPSSSANHLRMAIENLLTHLKIKRFKIEKKKRKLIFLHTRIKSLPKKHDHIKEYLLAIKWLGNAGSHSDKEISVDDVIDSYRLIQEVLKELFDNKKHVAQKIAKRINKKKGP